MTDLRTRLRVPQLHDPGPSPGRQGSVGCEGSRLEADAPAFQMQRSLRAPRPGVVKKDDSVLAGGRDRLAVGREDHRGHPAVSGRDLPEKLPGSNIPDGNAAEAMGAGPRCG